jgi:GH15 family glucan-1,4-alpha-glucosidase
VAEGLAGYRGMGPVRVGNAAYYQIQHDAYGQIVLSNVQAFFDERLFRQATVEDFASLEKVGERAWEMHDQPDAGLWEFRTRTSVHTYSSVMSWAACDRLANAAGVLGLDERAALWSERAASIRQTIEREAWYEPEQRFAATFGGDELDASLLQAHRTCASSSRRTPVSERTVRCSRKGAPQGRAHAPLRAEDDFGLPETAFNFCTFWLIEALHIVGRTEEGARALREDTGAAHARGPPFGRHRFPEPAKLWGNYPQTYSLVGLINCAVLPFQGRGARSVSRLIVISNRVAAPTAQGEGGAQGGSRRAFRRPSRISRLLVRLVRQQDRRIHRPDQLPAP